MKHLLLCLAMLPLLAIAQVEETGDVIHFSPDTYGPSGHVNTDPTQKTAVCGLDTIEYATAKAVGLSALSINNATSGYAVSQYFNCPQEITISGAEFFGYKIDLVGGVSLDATVQIFAAGADSLPTGLPLATGTVAVDTNFYAGNLDLLSKVVNFAPIQVNVPYVVVVENNTANGMGFIFNDYNTADGQQEWLCSVNIGGNWLHGYDISVGGVPLDADGLIHPLVQYTIVSSFTASDYCFQFGPTITFTNNSSPIFQDRMYSLAEYVDLTSLSYFWDFGDGTPGGYAIDTFQVYGNTAVPYTVTLSDTMYGWTSDCFTDTMATIGFDLVPDFNFVPAGAGQINFTDMSATGNAVFSWLWDFGDGNTSTQQNPSHTYLSTGNYTVCLTATNPCGTDSTCQTVNVTVCSNPAVSFSEVNNDPDFTFNDASTTTGNVTYAWNFGDGNTSTAQNPTNSYFYNGTYTVTLVVTDDCGMDSTTTMITVTNGCSDPVAAFNDTNNDPSFTFNNTSTSGAGTVYSWDFGDGNSSTMMSPTHTYDSNGSFTVVLTVTDSCGTHTTNMSVTVNNACEDPAAAFTQSGTEPTFTFTNTSTATGSATYSWDMGDGTTYSTMDAMHTYASNNTYTVTLTVTDSCGTNTTTQNVTVSTIGLDELGESTFIVFPNPADDMVTVESGELIATISIYDAAGREVISKEVGANTVEISTAALAQGQYVLKANLADGSENVMHLEVMH